ncbi:MAG TPA: arylsulfotransferase family protein [Solirubrobacteraceae bacterium]|nr:arylsulfotransferase family protein [Solirubrobacteraceae bacterium]
MTTTDPHVRPPAPDLVNRRQLLRAAVAAAGAVAAGGAAFGVSRAVRGSSSAWLASSRVDTGADGAVRHFHSRPDLLPATTRVTGRSGAPGYLFVGPAAVGGSQSGPVIVDAGGDPVWFTPQSTGDWLTNFSVQRYRGAPVLTWWEGTVANGYGSGEAVIADTSYREIARVRAANGRRVDLHELLLTDAGTALVTCAPQTVATDLSSLGGSRSADTLESVLQEVDIATGRLVMEWRSLQHIGVEESYRQPSATFDYLHANSIDVTPDGHLLLSARHTWAVYKLDRHSGAVIWRLGGKRSDFAMGPASQFAWQHDARLLDARSLTVFDDGYDGVTRTHAQSRAVLLDVDSAARRVSLRRAFVHPDPISASAMGSARRLSDGHIIVGWGSSPAVTEFTAAGRPVTDLYMAPTQKSYRGFRQDWSGTPAEAPAVATARSSATGAATLFASWNGATAATGWRVYGGARRSDLRELGVVTRRGFETAIELGTGEGYAAVAALDAHGRELRRSETIAVA